MASTNRILIIGALGNLGILTARKLSRRTDVTLRLTSHRPEGVAELRKEFPRAEVVLANWMDEASLREAVRAVTRVLVIMTDFVIDEAVATPNLIRAIQAAGSVELVLRFIALPPGLDKANLTPQQLATRAGAMLTLVAKPLLDASQLPLCYVNAACWIGFNIHWFFAQDIRDRREIRMPAATDMARRWVTEGDVSDTFVRILTDSPSAHIGREYRLAGGPRYNYAELAQLISQMLGERVSWIDDDTSLKRVMGDRYDKMLTYLEHEVEAYRDVPSSTELEQLLQRPRTYLSEYLESIRESLA